MPIYAPAPPVNQAIMMDLDTKVAAISGPVGTGKTHDAVGMSMLIQMTHQRPFEGVRRTKFLVARRNSGELENSIVKDVEKYIIPDSGEKKKFIRTYGKYPTISEVRFDMDDGTAVECDIYYFAFDDEDASEKIKSIDFTSAFIVEAQQLSSAKVIGNVWDRTRRYPNSHQGGICFQFKDESGKVVKECKSGVLRFDINMTAKSHWMYDYLVKNNKPVVDKQGVEVPARKHYEQPAALIFRQDDEGTYEYKGENGFFDVNPEFEPYTKNQPLGMQYWIDILDQAILDGDDDKIQRDVLGEFGSTSPGKAVHKNYKESKHLSKNELEYIPGRPVYIGVDNGKDNCWIFAQEDWNGRLRVIDEIINAGEDNQKLVSEAMEEDVGPYLRLHFPDYSYGQIIFILDPAMRQKESGFGVAQQDIVRRYGTIKYPRTDKTQPRLDAVDWYLRGNRILLSNKCTFLADGLSGGYHYPKSRATGNYGDTPRKNDYAHAVEAFQQLCLFMRAGQATKSHSQKRVKPRKPYKFIG